MASLNPLSVEDPMCNFGATAWVMLEMLKASRCPRTEGLLLWQEGWDGNRRSCQWDSFSVDIAWLSNVLFTGKTLSPSSNWESIHACRKRCPLGECFCALRPPPLTRNPEPLGEGSEGPAAFTPLGTERFPFSRTKGWIHHSTSYDQKHLNIFGEDYSCVLVGKF